MSTKKEPFTAKDGIRIQQQQLHEWRSKLAADCYLAVEAHCKLMNSALTSSDHGDRVFRGNDITAFIQNWRRDK